MSLVLISLMVGASLAAQAAHAAVMAILETFNLNEVITDVVRNELIRAALDFENNVIGKGVLPVEFNPIAAVLQMSIEDIKTEADAKNIPYSGRGKEAAQRKAKKEQIEYEKVLETTVESIFESKAQEKRYWKWIETQGGNPYVWWEETDLEKTERYQELIEEQNRARSAIWETIKAFSSFKHDIWYGLTLDTGEEAHAKYSRELNMRRTSGIRMFIWAERIKKLIKKVTKQEERAKIEARKTSAKRARALARAIKKPAVVKRKRRGIKRRWSSSEGSKKPLMFERTGGWGTRTKKKKRRFGLRKSLRSFK